jgi:hypothetical protein
MSATPTPIRRRIRRSVAAGGTAAVAAVSLLASPGAALASTVTAGGVASAGAVHPDDTYIRVDNATLHGRIITLWFNDTTGQWHAELAVGGAGDKVYLDYTSYAKDVKKGYSVASATITGNGTLVNTSDHAAIFARACAVALGDPQCTGWDNDLSIP